MPFLEEDWSSIYRSLGYSSEKEMLTDLYETQGFSLSQIAGLVKKSVPTVRRRVLMAGLETRSRGGPNHIESKLAHVSDELLFGLNRAQLIERYQVSSSAIYEEKRRRRIKHELCNNSPNRVAEETPPNREGVPYGSGTVVPEE